MAYKRQPAFPETTVCSRSSCECRPVYHRHRRVSVVRVGFHIHIGLPLRMKSPSSSFAPCCSLPDLTDPLWLHVGCRSCPERNGRSDNEIVPAMIIVAWYNCCGRIARSFLLTRIVRRKQENGNEKIATVFVKLYCGINPLPTAYAPATFIVIYARHIGSPSY